MNIDDRWIIQDDLLANILVSSDNSSRWRDGGFAHWQASNRGIPYLFLYYYAVKHLGLARLPGHEDTRYAELVGSYDFKDNNPFDRTPAESLESAYSELAAVHEFTAKKIVRTLRSDRVHVVRRVSGTYAKRIWAAYLNARESGAHFVEFPTFSVNSFSGPDLDQPSQRPIAEAGYYWHYQLQFVLEIEARDAIACFSSVAYAKGRPTATMESPEWIVVNRDERGLVRIPIAQVSKLGDWPDTDVAPFRRAPFEWDKRRVVLPFCPMLTRQYGELARHLTTADTLVPWWCQFLLRRRLREALHYSNGGMPL